MNKLNVKIYLDQVIARCGSDGKIDLNHSQKGCNLLTFEDELNKVIYTIVKSWVPRVHSRDKLY